MIKQKIIEKLVQMSEYDILEMGLLQTTQDLMRKNGFDAFNRENIEIIASSMDSSIIALKSKLALLDTMIGIVNESDLSDEEVEELLERWAEEDKRRKRNL